MPPVHGVPAPNAKIAISPAASAATRRVARSPAPINYESDGSENDTETPAADEPVRYESFEIATPVAEETLWNIEGVLNVSLALTPALQPGHQVRVYFDGNPQIVAGTSFQLQEVWRGVHNLQAEVLDEAGRMMIRTAPNRFYVQQTTVR